MRSKERKSYRTSQQNIQAPRSPNPHLKKQPCFDKAQSTRINKPPLPPHPVSPNPKHANISMDQLLKENSELRKEIIQLRVHQFYHFDDLKLKELINQLQSLKKQISRYKEQVKHLQLQNDFLLRTNQQLKIQLEKEICLRTKDNYSQENSKYMFKNASKCEEDIVQMSSQNVCMQETTLEETLEIGRHDFLSRRCKPKSKEKYHSPRRNKESILETANQYLIYRKNKQKKTSSEKLIT